MAFLYDTIGREQYHIYQDWFNRIKADGYNTKVNEDETYKKEVDKASPADRVNFLIFCIEYIRGKNQYVSNIHTGYYDKQVLIAQQLVRKKLPMTEDDVLRILQAMFERNGYDDYVVYYPIKYLLNQIKEQHKATLSENLREYLRYSCQCVQESGYLLYKDKQKSNTINQIREITGDSELKPAFPNPDPFAEYANTLMANLSSELATKWAKIFNLAIKVTGGKPSQKYLNETKILLDDLGEDNFKTMIYAWFDWLLHNKETIITTQHILSDGRTYDNKTVQIVLSPNNEVLMKGLAWACSHFYDNEMLGKLSALALRSYSGISFLPFPFASLGNACIFALYRANGVAHLSRLSLRIKAKNVQNLIAKYLDELASERGISRDEMEDMAVDDFGLQQGSREYAFNDYTAKLTITGVGKSDLQWFKPDGSPQKTVPAFVKEAFADQLKEIKATQKNLNTMLTAQRDRLDRLLRSERRVSIAHAQQYYWQHGLMSWLTLPLIWQFYQDDNDTVGVSALCLNGVWVNELGEPIDVSGCLKVNLFHPALATQQSVVNWRNLLIKNEIIQPMKQAFREIYLLTDAEINTRTYSNRFAAHILKQHQYMTLARGRGWSGSLCGAYDDGRDDANVSLDLPEYDLTAHFWTAAIEENFVDSGIWQYISTDQVRFTRNENVVNLIDIPPRIFSEVLRDVDLFVGVASVGNDPTWADNGGLPNHRNYWQSYSFGDLSEVAKTRKSVLEMLLPRLKIAKVSHIDGNFLVVKGKLRTYKIHIGSTNILMLPNDQYLCIVPDRSQKDVTGKLFIPFEGDNGLSVVLSKAMLLMDDDKITDGTITSQIGRK